MARYQLSRRAAADVDEIAECTHGDDVRITDCCPHHLGALTDILGRIGVSLTIAEDSVSVRATAGELDGVDVETARYPHFPTDMPAQSMALLTQTRGASCLSETIFENRFMHASELARMAPASSSVATKPPWSTSARKRSSLATG